MGLVKSKVVGLEVIVALLGALVLSAGCTRSVMVSCGVPGPAAPPGTWQVVQINQKTVVTIFTYPGKDHAVQRLEVFASDDMSRAAYFRIGRNGRLEPAAQAESDALERALAEALNNPPPGAMWNVGPGVPPENAGRRRR
ncbi:hypothetical protein ACFL59_05950 [Planctomycetota bacterium]